MVRSSAFGCTGISIASRSTQKPSGRGPAEVFELRKVTAEHLRRVRRDSWHLHYKHHNINPSCHLFRPEDGFWKERSSASDVETGRNSTSASRSPLQKVESSRSHASVSRIFAHAQLQ